MIQRQVAEDWRRHIHDCYNLLAPSINIAGLGVDFRELWCQWFASTLEEEQLFLGLACRRRDQLKSAGITVAVAGNAFSGLASKLGVSLGANDVPYTMKWARYLDSVWHWFVASIQRVKLLRSLLFSRPTDGFRGRTFKFVWSGISPSEIADSTEKLDIGFLNTRQLVDPRDSLFVLPQAPGQESEKWLAHQRSAWISKSEMFSILRPGERIRALVALTAALFRTIRSSRHSEIRWIYRQFVIQALPWIYFGRKFAPEVFLSSVSASWPEIPAVAVMNALGVRTVVWHYSSNVFNFAQGIPAFKDTRIVWSTVVSREVWIWNEAGRRFLSRRTQFFGLTQPRFRVIGPVMCGDFRVLTADPSEVRQSRGLKESKQFTYLAAFDVPSVSTAVRRRLGFGPNIYTLEMLERFFEDLAAVLDEFPEVVLVIKPKRDFKAGDRDYSKAMWRILDPDGVYTKRQQVTLLHPNIDPYIPIAMADICVGLPFTSPVLAAVGNRRHGIFHDPLGTTRQFEPVDFEKLITRDRETLMSRVRAVVNGQAKVEAYEDLVGPPGDPTVHFARELRALAEERRGDAHAI